MITYYLSGPMRGVTGYNYAAFHAVEKALADYLSVGSNEPEQGLGWEILNPARNFSGETHHETTEYMQLDMQMVLDSDVIVLLPGWEASPGANREVELAIWTGKRFMRALPGKGDAGETLFEEIDVPTKHESPRSSVVTEAHQLITGDRNSQYGPPTQDFQRTAAMATGFGFGVTVDGHRFQPLESHHVAILMVLLKMSRLAWTPTKRDSWVDTAGYAGCGYECAVEEAAHAAV